MSERASLTVEIGGERYTLRTDADPEYARRCAAYLDEQLGQILDGGSLVEPHKAIVLAALGIIDELFRAREETERLRARVGGLAARLSADIRAATGPDELAPPS